MPSLAENSPVAATTNRNWLQGPRPLETDFQRLIRDGIDWNKSPLGPIASWPAQLKQNVLFVTEDPRPACVMWGSLNNLACVYNEHYATTLGSRHPAVLGQLLQVCWPESWEAHSRVLHKQAKTGGAVVSPYALRVINYDGFLTEIYLSHTIIPIISLETECQLGLYLTVRAFIEPERSSPFAIY